MYNMRASLAALLIFAAFAMISCKPHIRNSPRGIHTPPVLEDGPFRLDDHSEDEGPRGIHTPPVLEDGPFRLDDHSEDEGPRDIHTPPVLEDGPFRLDDHSEDEDMVTVDDMTLPKRMIKPMKHGHIMAKRQAFVDGSQEYKWPKANGVVTVPYTAASGVDTEVLKRAIEVFNAKTCVRFVERGSQTNYVEFRISGSCVAQVGNQESGMQTCDLTSGCSGKKGKVLHEMMHILSFLHEQCRPDRDSYVTVHMDRILEMAKGSFEKVEGKDMGLAYDCDSILHYRSAAFAKTSGQETITSSHCSHLGNGDTRLSLLDYKRVNKLYDCGKPDYKYYTVRVVTDSSMWSGTDCFIYLTLHGSQHTSAEFELDLSTDTSANLFETGSTDTFNYMAYRNDLGSITGISVRMVAHGSGQAWWPNKFTVTDPASGTSVAFTNNKWLSPASTYGNENFPKQ